MTDIDWIGRTETVEQVITDTTLQAMIATLGKENTGDTRMEEVPPLWHWLYLLEFSPWQRLAVDGHQQKGNFLPPVKLPRRMWAGSEVQFHAPLRVGSTGRRESRIQSVDNKQGRTGELVFVSVSHDIYSADELAISEIQNIVYREAAGKSEPGTTAQAAPATADFTQTVTPDPLLLFRYSALTFNAHRIHYDRPYATETEGYPGLIVHGPLLATLLVELLMAEYPQAELKNFQFRALKPVFDLEPFQVCGNKPNAEGICELWISDSRNELCMQAKAVLK